MVPLPHPGAFDLAVVALSRAEMGERDAYFGGWGFASPVFMWCCRVLVWPSSEVQNAITSA